MSLQYLPYLVLIAILSGCGGEDSSSKHGVDETTAAIDSPSRVSPSYAVGALPGGFSELAASIAATHGDTLIVLRHVQSGADVQIWLCRQWREQSDRPQRFQILDRISLEAGLPAARVILGNCEFGGKMTSGIVAVTAANLDAVRMAWRVGGAASRFDEVDAAQVTCYREGE